MFNLQKGQPVMLIEDNDDDYEATLRALKSSGVSETNQIIRFDSGEAALAYLRREGQHTQVDSSPRPGVILLDLNMPGMSGQDVLAEIKSSDDLRDIPVVILTTSDNERDVDTCYDLGANTYIKKPVNIDNFFAAIKKLSEYWFNLAILPKGSGKNAPTADAVNLFKF